MPLDLIANTPIPAMLPEGMAKVVGELKQARNQEECLKKAYDILASKYRGNRIRTYTRFFRIFQRDIASLWGQNGFLHCTNINYVLRTLLIKSEWFKDEDVRLRWTFIWYVSPHQYVQAKIGGRWTNVDIWANNYGVKFGDYAHGL